MKHNYITMIIKRVLVLVLFLGTLSSFGQNIHFSFANAQNTNDGTNDFYEADVMIDASSDFKLGKGLLYFNYNTAAFGTFVSGGGNLEVTYPSGYILDTKDNVTGLIAVYGNFTQNDNTGSRFTFAYTQLFGSGSYNNNVSSVPTKLFHIKIKYLDVNEAPMVTFEESIDDQFSTACGPTTPLTGVNCSTFPGTILVNDTFDSTGGTLGIHDELLAQGLRFYPNPVRSELTVDSQIPLTKVEIYNVLGKMAKEVTSKFEHISLDNLSNGIYIVRLYSEDGVTTKKLIKE